MQIFVHLNPNMIYDCNIHKAISFLFNSSYTRTVVTAVPLIYSTSGLFFFTLQSEWYTSIRNMSQEKSLYNQNKDSHKKLIRTLSRKFLVIEIFKD